MLNLAEGGVIDVSIVTRYQSNNDVTDCVKITQSGAHSMLLVDHDGTYGGDFCMDRPRSTM